MKLILAHFDGVFGLRGEICFTPRIPVILYAPNIAGKTNVFLGSQNLSTIEKG